MTTTRTPGIRNMRQISGRAFTLVELLVVVSIIALLISILLPSMRKARAQTKSLLCKANMRSMGQAFIMYAESFQGVLPPVVDSGATENRWPVPFHLGGIIKASLARFNASGIATKTPETSIFICPEEKAPRVISWNSPPAPHPVDRVEVGGSYALTEESQRINGELKRLPPVLRKLESCRRGSEVFAVVENYRPLENTSSPGWCFNRGVAEMPPGTYITAPPLDSRAFYYTYRDMTGAPVTLTPTIEARRGIGGHHSGMGNALCFDTHAESYKPDKIAYNQVSWTRWPGTNKPPGGL